MKNEDNQNQIMLEELLYRERYARLICAELNNFVDLKSTLITIITYIKEFKDFEAVSIRLHDDGDYPYFIYNGFPDSFIKHENKLCSKGKNGERTLDPETGKFKLDCLCGNVIRGRVDVTLPIFTKKGSFWTNGTTAMLAQSTEENLQGTTSNYCNASGYESVAMIPIKVKDEIVGLIQVNDKRTDMFTRDIVEFIEMIGQQIGLAVRNSLTYTKLKEAMDEISILRKMIPICSHCNKMRDDSGYWHGVEKYFHKYAKTDFTHSMCPHCVKELYPEMEDEDFKE
ncbi:MAG: GAF domain-containing protein [bacterium]|nr:GAF domain-containing protein [bacterium]